ncbi:MAG TPA: hypothetical protein VKR38_04635 [Usitatibacter sp.]|nr:hypothetical protein [Usitatibacter sp.]
MRNYTRLFYIFCAYVVWEGALRKWIWPEGSTVLFLLKDVLLFAALAALLGSGIKRPLPVGRIAPMYQMAIIAWVVATFARVFVDGLSFETVVGLRYYLSAIPMLILVPQIFADLDSLDRFAYRSAIFAVPVLALGFVQYLSPIDAPINQYAWRFSEDQISGFGVAGYDVGGRFLQDRARITSTFSYISPYAAYLQCILFASLALLTLSTTKRVRWIAGAVSGLCVLNMFMNGSRAAIVTTLVFALPIVALAIQRRSISVTAALAAGIVVLAGIVWADALDLFLARVDSSGDSDSRVWGAVNMPLATLRDTTFVGHGMGSSFAGMGEYTGTGLVENAIFNEVIHDRVGLELGVAGYVFVLVLKLAAGFAFAHLAWQSRNARVQAWSLASLAYQCAWLWQVPFYNSVGAVFYFFFVGLYPLLKAYAALESTRLKGRKVARDATRPLVTTLARDVDR